MQNLDRAVAFVREIDKLKAVERKGLTYHQRRFENSAEHSWHLSLSVLVLAEFSSTPIDRLKALKMAMIHDLVEIDAGDTFAYGDESNKFAEERKAAERIFGLLPDSLGQELKALWLEFEAKESPEAKLVNAVDRFLPIYSNYLNEGFAWKKHGVTEEKVVRRNEATIRAGLPELWEKVSEMLQEGRTRNFFSPSGNAPL